ncbi:MAG: 16S rRNA (cytosine(967)-C(5))-methyltransferase RsmB [Methylococcales bacterium]|nr:16S rRNA (cytosine(967)-C(5))-methyltransferase RsmB [Methylococcales bacterium]
MNTRLIAARVLTRIIQDGQSLTSALDAALASVEPSKDQAFIQAVCYGVCRSYQRLDFILNQLLTKPIKDTELKALALVGLYQLSFMRVKPHAAVSETVLATAKKPWAKGLINAVLRNYLREQAKLEALADQEKTAASCHPAWLMALVEQDWPEHATQLFHENNQQAPMALRVNLARGSREHYIQLLADQVYPAIAAEHCPSGLVLLKPVAVEVLPGFADGLVSVQDTAAQLAAYLLDVQAGQRVLDVCAAPGGKAAHILEHQTQLKTLVAVDIDAARLQRVSDGLQRLQLTAQLTLGDATQPQTWWDGQTFERILLDAPCSALGVIRRHPDIKLLRRADDIPALQALQQSMLRAIWPLLAPGGILLYATCSILKQENEQQIATFLADHADAIEQPIAADWGLAGLHGRQILTGEAGMDGFYYAKLLKV